MRKRENIFDFFFGVIIADMNGTNRFFAKTFWLAQLCLAQAAMGALFVSESGSDSNPGTADLPFRSIQAAVDAAPRDGCDIFVSEGTYYVMQDSSPQEALLIEKPVRIYALGAAERTVLDAEKKRRAVRVNADGALLSGITIRNGKHNAWNSFGGAGIAKGVVSNAVIEACEGYHADGVLISGGTLTHSVVRNNISNTAVYGLGIHITAGLVAHTEVYGNVKTDVLDARGGGIYAKGGIVTNCTVRDNFLGNAGFSRSQDYNVAMSNRGAGIYIEGSALVTGCTIKNNAVAGSGGAVYVAGGVLCNSLVYGNSTTNVYDSLGGSVYVEGGVVSNITVASNFALRGAGGLYQKGGTVKDSIVFGNGFCDFGSDGGTHQGIYTNNPGFTDPERGNYALSSASEAKSVGAFLVAPDTGLGCVFSQDRKMFRGGGAVTFTAKSHGAVGVPAYEWDFGDGTVVRAGAVATHDYAPGIYSVKLKVIDVSGEASSVAPQTVWALPEKCHVYKNGSDQSPYLSQESASTCIYRALALRPREIEIGEGVWDVSSAPLVLFNEITVRGAAGRDKVVLDAMDKKFSRVAVLDHEKALLSGVTVKRGRQEWARGAGVQLLKGRVHDCIIRENFSYSGPAFHILGGVMSSCLVTMNRCGGGNTYGEAGVIGGGLLAGTEIFKAGDIASSSGKGTLYVHGQGTVVSNCFIYGNYMGGSSKNNMGGGIYMSDGLVTGCVISNNTASVQGGGVAMTGGTLRNSLVAGNCLDSSVGGEGAGVFQSGGVIENCTVVRNRSQVAAGGLFQTGGGAVNTIIYHNLPSNYLGSGGSLSHCGLDPVAPGEGNTQDEPYFADPQNGDWRLSSLASRYVDGGVALPWMADDAADLGGQKRICGDAPDIGAYEYSPSGTEPFAVAFGADKTSGYGELTVGFSAVVSKYPAGECLFVWDFGDGSPIVEANGSSSIAHTYSGAGKFTVALTVRRQGESAQASRTDFISVIPGVCFVSATGGNAVPYDTPEKAALKISDALAMGSPVVMVLPGTYSDAGIALVSAQRLVSAEGPEKTAISASQQRNLVVVNHEGASIEGFTLKGASIPDWNETTGGSALRVVSGVASNIIIRDSSKHSWGACYIGGTGKLYDSVLTANKATGISSVGAALCVTGGGFVSGCVVSNNTSLSNVGLSGGGIGLYQTGGIVSNTLFTGNFFPSSGGAAAGIYSLGGLATHCIVSNNTATAYAGGVYCKGGVVRNCLISGNRVDSLIPDGGGGVLLESGTAESLTIAGNVSYGGGSGIVMRGGRLANSVVALNTGSREIVATGGEAVASFSAEDAGIAGFSFGDPMFCEEGDNPFVPSPFSPLADGAAAAAWMENACDLAGRGRITGSGADIGAYESSAADAGGISFRIVSVAELEGGTRRIRFRLLGLAEEVYSASWVFGNGEEQSTSSQEAECDYAPGLYTVSVSVAVPSSGETFFASREGVVKVPSKVAYLSQDPEASPRYPYATAQSAARDLETALATGAGEVIVMPGTYSLPGALWVAGEVLVRGETANPEDVVLRLRKLTGTAP